MHCTYVLRFVSMLCSELRVDLTCWLKFLMDSLDKNVRKNWEIHWDGRFAGKLRFFDIFTFFPTKLLSFQTILFYFLKNFADLGKNLRQFWRILSFSLFVIEFKFLSRRGDVKKSLLQRMSYLHQALFYYRFPKN